MACKYTTDSQPITLKTLNFPLPDYFLFGLQSPAIT